MDLTEAEQDRLRKVFGMEEEERIPRVREEPLRDYLQYLSRNLDLPDRCRYEEPEGKGGESSGYTVDCIRLLGAEEHPVLGPRFGLLCEVEEDRETVVVPLARITKLQNEENRTIVDDYARWYWATR